MRQIALILGLASLVWSTTTLSQPRRIAGIRARTVVSDGQFGYVDNGSTIYRLQRTEEGIRKLDSVGYEGNKSEAALYIPRDQTTGFLVFKDSVCSVDWRAIKDDRMMCTGGVSLGWGGYTGGITMGKLNVCGGSGAYTFQIYQTSKPVLQDSLGGSDRKTCEVYNADQIDVRRGTDVMLFHRCLTVAECGETPRTTIPANRFYTRNRFASNGANILSVDSLGRLGSWDSPATDNAQPIQGYKPGPNRSVELAAGNHGNAKLVAIGFDSTLVFGRPVDLGLETYAKLDFDAAVGAMDLDKDVLWMQVGGDIVSFDIAESISGVDGAPAARAFALRAIGRALEVQPLSGGTEVRILGADGRLEARIPAGSGPVRWIAPGPGLYIVRMGASSRALMVP